MPSSMFAIIKTRWHTRPLSRRAKRRSSAAPGSLRKKYTDIAPTRRCRSVEKLYHILGLGEARIIAERVPNHLSVYVVAAHQHTHVFKEIHYGFVDFVVGTIVQYLLCEQPAC